jgi:hypothetical protein
MQKEIAVVFYDYRLLNPEWSPPEVDAAMLEGFLDSFRKELEPLGIIISWDRENQNLLEVKGYRDLLNTVRLRSPKDHIGNLCLGHIIGQSANCDFLEDIRRGVSRVAFAPEMIEPEGSNKVVCHNCGCGC